MAENLNPNQNPKPVQSKVQNSPSVPVSPLPARAPEPNLGEPFKLFGGPKIFLAVGAVVLLAVVLGALYFRNLKRSKPTDEPSLPPLASIVPGATPPQLPKVEEDTKKTQLRAFFQKASPANFKEAFLDTLPAAAADAYVKYSSAASLDDKQAAARGFYIILNNPGAPSSDSQFLPFTKDVRAELEKELGKPLF